MEFLYQIQQFLRMGYYTGSDKVSSGAGSLNTVSQIGTSSGTFRGDGRSGDDPAKIYRMGFLMHIMEQMIKLPILCLSLHNLQNLEATID